MTNLYRETIEALGEHKKTINDIVFISGNGHEIPIENFVEVAKGYDYDAGYGGTEVPVDLMIVGKGWWLERHEYDGSEWWEYRRPPSRPGTVRRITGICDTGHFVYEEGGEK